MTRQQVKSLGWRAGVLLATVWMASTATHARVPVGQAPKSGALHVSFLFMPPTSVEPTYHTAMWIEDDKGKLVRTLYVSNELSNQEYKLGLACPDWTKQAHWDKAPKAEVDAVTAPTPNVGSASMGFDLAELGVPPGTYRFKLQVHITEKANVLHSGTFVAGAADAEVKLDVAVGPGKLTVTDQFVRDVEVRYVALRK